MERDHAVGVSSGTAALHCIVRALGLPEGGEVITTPYSFVASANVLLFEKLQPQFVDIDSTTYNIDPGRIEAAITSWYTCAILAVDVFGRPAPWPRLRAIADAHDLALIADSCEALGASIGGTPIGSLGRCGRLWLLPEQADYNRRGRLHHHGQRCTGGCVPLAPQPRTRHAGPDAPRAPGLQLSPQ